MVDAHDNDKPVIIRQHRGRQPVAPHRSFWQRLSDAWRALWGGRSEEPDAEPVVTCPVCTGTASVIVGAVDVGCFIPDEFYLN